MKAAARSRRGPREGFTLAELLVSAAAGGLVLAALTALLAAQGRVVHAHAERMRLAEAVRVPTIVAAAEVAFALPDADLRLLGPGALALRALRGIGVPCGAGEPVPVRYRGLRQPEPDKDSVLVLSPDGERALPLLASTGAAPGCDSAPGERLLSWTLPEAPPAGALLLLFESGSYHLEERAFRYRRGAAGRQPLTESVLDTRRGGFRLLTGPPALEVDLVGRSDPPAGRSLSARARIGFLNAVPDSADGGGDPEPPGGGGP